MAKTPGYNCRISIAFDVIAGGRKVAYRWTRSQMRWFRMGLAEAELLIATGAADLATKSKAA